MKKDDNLNNNNELKNLKNRIWITSKSRIYAEKRFRLYDIVSHILLAVLSVIVIAITLLKDLLPASVPVDVYTVVYSIIILAASIIVFGFRFGETATLHRECYLHLQKLCDSPETNAEISKQYHDVLSSYPNHSDIDFESLVISRTLFKSSELFLSEDTPIVWSYSMITRWLLHLVLLFSFPTIILFSIASIFGLIC